MPRKATGRKRSAPFATRLSEDLKKQLAASAKANSNGNMSREVERLLRQSLALQKEKDEKLRAVTYLVARVAEFVGREWATNPWLFKAFKTGVGSLLTRLEPKGEVVRPAFVDDFEDYLGANDPRGPVAKKLSSTPEGWGEFAGYFVWRSLLHLHAPNGIVPDRGSWLLAMPQARESLGISFVPHDELTEITRRMYSKKEDEK